MLTEREIEVLKLKKGGLNQVDISKSLKISQPAVSGLYNNALKKITEARETIRISEEIGIEAK